MPTESERTVARTIPATGRKVHALISTKSNARTMRPQASLSEPSLSVVVHSSTTESLYIQPRSTAAMTRYSRYVLPPQMLAPVVVLSTWLHTKTPSAYSWADSPSLEVQSKGMSPVHHARQSQPHCGSHTTSRAVIRSSVPGVDLHEREGHDYTISF
jgi:hypothetical protein